MASSAKPPPIVINGDKPFISEPTGPVSPMPKAAPSFTISEATPISSPMVNDGVTPGDSSNATLSESRRSQKEDIWSELLCEPPHLWLEERRNAQQDTASYIIRATSVNRLLYQIVLDFPEEDRGRHRNLNEYTLPSTFLMVHRWVVSSCSLFIRIARLYQGPSASVLADSISAASTPLPASSLGAASDTSSRHSHSRTASASGADGFALSSSGGAARHSRTPSRNSVESYGGAPSTAASDDVSPLPPYASSVTGSDGMATGGCPLSQWSHVSPQELVADADLLRKFRSRAVRVLRYWLESQPNDFVDEAVSFQLDAFMEELRANEPSLAAMLAESRQVAFSTLPQTTAARVQTTASPSLVNFQSADASLLAAQFTVLEFDYYRNIRPLEFFVSSSRDFNGRVVSPNLFLSIQHFNRISFWVVAMILSETDTQRRALVFGKLIRIARKLRGLKNYNTLMAFFAGFKHNAIHRLKETFDALPRKLQSALSDLGDFLTPEHNFEQYRRDVDAQRGAFYGFYWEKKSGNGMGRSVKGRLFWFLLSIVFCLLLVLIWLDTIVICPCMVMICPFMVMICLDLVMISTISSEHPLSLSSVCFLTCLSYDVNYVICAMFLNDLCYGFWYELHIFAIISRLFPAFFRPFTDTLPRLLHPVPRPHPHRPHAHL